MQGKVVSLVKIQFQYNISPLTLNFIDRGSGTPPARLEVVMQTIGLVISIIASMAFFAGLSAVIYMTLPASIMEESARHGRFSGLGERERTPGGTAGNARVSMRRALLGQSV
jgi:hypothetical protein